MAGEVEHASWTMKLEGINNFTAPSAGPATISSDNPQIENNIVPPKGSTLQLTRMRGFITDTTGIGSSTKAMKLVLARLASRGSPQLSFAAIETVWSYGLSRSLAGTPADQSEKAQGAVIEVDFDRKHRSTSIRNSIIGSNNIGTPNSGSNMGFRFLHQAVTADYNYLMELHVDYDIEWHENSGRSSIKRDNGNGSGAF